MAWMLVNEAETSQRDRRGRSALVPFASDMATRVKLADPHHLVTLGTQANGALGTSGPDFRALYSLPDPGSAECRSVEAPLACSFAIARQIGVPLLIGEVGIAATDPE